MFFLVNPGNQKHHVSRSFYLEKLSEYAKRGKNTAIVGPKKSGKTFLARELVQRLGKEGMLPVYMGLNRTSTPPENFSIELVGGISFWFLGAISSDFVKFQTIEHLLSIKEKLGKSAADIVDFLGNELQKIKPDQKLMLKKSFSFAEEISKKSGKKIILVLDDFENIFDLNNFNQIKDVLPLVDFKSKNVNYIVASSSSTLLRNSLKNLNFEFEEMQYFNSEESEKLIEKTIGKVDKKISDEIFSFSHGIPVLVKSISMRYKEVNNVKKAFLIELSCRNSDSYHYLESSLNDFLYRARGEAMPKTVVKILAFSKNPRLTEISRKLYRSAPVTKSILERILLVDMIVKTDNKYSFANPVLKEWLKLYYSGFEFDEVPSDEILKHAEEVLNEQQ